MNHLVSEIKIIYIWFKFILIFMNKSNRNDDNFRITTHQTYYAIYITNL
jgi:hypothetical protein